VAYNRTSPPPPPLPSNPLSPSFVFRHLPSFLPSSSFRSTFFPSPSFLAFFIFLWLALWLIAFLSPSFRHLTSPSLTLPPFFRLGSSCATSWKLLTTLGGGREYERGREGRGTGVSHAHNEGALLCVCVLYVLQCPPPPAAV
jgi:hypothetical protein